MGNAFFLRRLLEAKSHRASFVHVQKVDVVIEHQYENRFRDVFKHIFKGMRFDLQYQNPTERRNRRAVEEVRRIEKDRQCLLQDSKAKNLASIGRFLRMHHALYRDRPSSYFDIRTNWYIDKFRPWAEKTGDPWLKNKGKQAGAWVKQAGSKAVQTGAPALKSLIYFASEAVHRLKKRRGPRP